ncbi:MAG TPA: YciI family protein [Verrucomicrobiae bacterium]|nr:YciI family protein [Verrucomicrobiae bacterium]
MTDAAKQPVYFVVFITTKYSSMEEAKRKAPEDIAAHMARSQTFHDEGKLLMGGAFLDHLDELVSTMAVLTSRAVAEDYVEDDPFVRNGMVSTWAIREWANMLR